jgi:uncharacterized protein (TIGR02117 family)
LLALYLLIVLAGLIPVNNDFEPTPDGVEIMVTSTEIHSDLVVPIRNETVDWSRYFPRNDFAGDVGGARYVALGWGNKDFFVNTPTAADVKVRVVLRALFCSYSSCMHVQMWDDTNIPPATRKTTISREQYRRLVEYVLNTFQRDEGDRLSRVAGVAYGPIDAFYEARGSYHALNTCNCWTGDALKAAGIRTGWYTPLPKTVTLYMPDARAP